MNDDFNQNQNSNTNSSYVDDYAPPPVDQDIDRPADSMANEERFDGQPSSNAEMNDGEMSNDEGEIKFDLPEFNPNEELNDDSSSMEPIMPPSTSFSDENPGLASDSDDSSDKSSSNDDNSVSDVNSGQSESLEDQNIFFLLGVKEDNEKLKEGFLDELQEVIWEDFLENDVHMLITSEEKGKYDSIMDRKNAANDKNELDKIQDELVEYLESLIPDLEEIMLEKAMDLKADLFMERISGMKEYHANSQDKLAKVNEAEKLMQDDKYYSAAAMLNQIET